MENIKGTKLFTKSDKNCLKICSEILAAGGLVAFPTETVYGLGANALDPEAVKGIFAAKQRPVDNPLIVHVDSLQKVQDLVAELPPEAELLAERFWPGPLTLVLSKREIVPQVTTGGLDTVAVRIPDHSLALELLKESTLPIAAPSANLSGRPSPTTAQHVIEDLAGRIEAIIDGGATGIGVESTVLSLTERKATLLRPGGITYEQLEQTLGRVEIDPVVRSELEKEVSQALAPGMKYQHYSPQAEVILVAGECSQIPRKIASLAKKYLNLGKKVGIMATQENLDFYSLGQIKVMGSRDRLAEISANLFKLLREFDSLGVDIILVEALPTQGLGLAIMNRLRKSADGQIIKA
ncbi:L-threonylcarbamoyladenylate synthase [Fuchsiella alkaliacetigena]|uniref:L-threonylcarbamoyladenylate synthase n=1 Tax=Fuchsiella alkaliacetigena TaxID=957042 RepID=UPI00200AAD2F|nr:L-threonylcarbamoyladenylate synthase [Fuchsiella alkaliacetigena]MCK8824598.1 L-threonylcarbamoyladenylate synthase [Fuchsiella alkaliacetigena]